MTEAVTALEVALYVFASEPSIDQALGPILAQRMDLGSMGEQVAHMGLTGSVRYLLPVVFPEWELPQNILEGCRTAIQQRQNIVHNGQRTVSEDVLRRSLASIRSMCDFFHRVTVTARGIQQGAQL